MIRNEGMIQPAGYYYQGGSIFGQSQLALDKSLHILEEKSGDADAITINGSYDIPIKIGDTWFMATSDVELDTATDLDTGAIAAGTDYYLYAINNSSALDFILSANATYPDGYAANTSKKVGGFHTLCANVGTIAGHDLTDYLATNILPKSIWDLTHRPISAPAGMVYDKAINRWIDIYLASGTGASTVSVNGGAISDTRDWMDFTRDGQLVFKQLLTDAQFQSAASGSNEETNIAGSADPGTTGGHGDTAGRRMISNIGCEDCTGLMYQWLDEQSWKLDGVDLAACQTWAWQNLTGAKGSLYKQGTYGDVKLRAGGYWTNGTHCGSRCRNSNDYRWAVHSNTGARFCAEPQ